jgi:hypothetical protein
MIVAAQFSIDVIASVDADHDNDTDQSIHEDGMEAPDMIHHRHSSVVAFLQTPIQQTLLVC